MAISTETIILKVEGQTDGAVRATEKLAQAQTKLGQAAQAAQAGMSGAAQAMADVPAAPTASLISKLGDGLKAAGFDAKSFSGGLKDIGKGLTFDLIRSGLKSLNTEIQGTAGATLSAAVNGAAMGAAFGGPLGAAIGGVAGALVGLVRGTETHTEAQLRAAAAAKKHADALQLVADGETKIREQRRGRREAEDLAYAEYDAASMKNTQIGSEASAADLERTRRAWRLAQIEREAFNRTDGAIWLEQQKREQDRLNAIRNIEAARARGTLTVEDAKRRIDDLNKSEQEQLDIVGQLRKKQEDAAQAVEKLNKALQAGKLTSKEYNDLLRATDDDYRARDDERKKREQEWIARQKQIREELKQNIKAWEPVLKQLDSPKPDVWAGAKAEEALAYMFAEYDARAGRLVEFVGDVDSLINELRGMGVFESPWNQKGLEERSAKLYEHDRSVASKMAELEKDPEPNLEADMRAYDALEKAKQDTKDKRKSRLAEMFGPLDEFNAYKAAFDGLASSVTGAMNAWITGSMSAGQAAKKAVGEYLSSLSAQLAIEALKEGAYAVASLIPGPFFNPAAAAGHAAAALKFGAAAAAAAVTARAMGKGGTQYGGSSSGGGASGGSGGSSDGSNGGAAQHQTVNYYIVGDSYAEDSPRMRQRNAERVVELGTQRTSAGRAE